MYQIENIVLYLDIVRWIYAKYRNFIEIGFRGFSDISVHTYKYCKIYMDIGHGNIYIKNRFLP